MAPRVSDTNEGISFLLSFEVKELKDRVSVRVKKSTFLVIKSYWSLYFGSLWSSYRAAHHLLLIIQPTNLLFILWLTLLNRLFDGKCVRKVIQALCNVTRNHIRICMMQLCI